MAIIGILAAIAIPQFIKYKQNAAISACESDLRNCMNDVSAQFALDSDTNTLNCNVTGSAFNGLVFSVSDDCIVNSTDAGLSGKEFGGYATKASITGGVPGCSIL